MQAAVNGIERDLLYDRRTFNGHELTLLQAHNLDGCGAAHSCLFFVLDHANHVLLGSVNAALVTILPTRHSALPDIRLTDPDAEPSQTTYTFNGQEYVANK